MKQKHKTKGGLDTMLISMAMLALLFFGNAIDFSGRHDAAAADDAANDFESASEIVEYDGENPCISEIQIFGEKALANFRDWMEQHFSNKSSSASLLPAAMAELNRFEESIDAQLQIFMQAPFINSANVTVTRQSEVIYTCSTTANSFKQKARSLLSMRAISTSEVKKASAFAEKYKQINAQLHELNLAVLKMSVRITTFEQKLPCYLTQCVGG